MLRPYTTDLPAGGDLEFFTNSDKTFGVVWNHDDHSPVVVDSAVCTLEFDVTPSTDPEVPTPPPVRQTFTPDLTKGDLAVGQVMFTVFATNWDTVAGWSGNWDIQAVSTVDGVTRVLRRAIFTVRQGIS